MKRLSFMCLLSFFGLFSCGSGYDNLDTEAFAKAVAGGDLAIVDVRTADEYAAGHLPGASNCDWFASDFMDKMASYPKETPLALYCRSGKRSAAAAAKLSKAGYRVSNLMGGYLAWIEEKRPVTEYAVETFFTDGGRPVMLTLIKHGTLALNYNGLSVHVDPVTECGKHTDYATEFPKADIILVTHEHFDHLDKDAVSALSKEGTLLVTNERCAEMLGYGTVMGNGDSMGLPGGVHLDAVPAYNTTEGRLQFHPKGRDNGFVLTIDGLRIYIAGDTEDIPEMADLKDIDIAFLPVNQPYTMTPEQCRRAAKTLSPKVLIPYHFGQTDLSSIPGALKDIDVRLRSME